MTLVNLYASRPHYADHLLPIWQALPVEHQGVRCAPREAVWGPHGRPRPDMPGLWMVASYSDAQSLQGKAAIYVEHGAGQTYPGDPRSAEHGAFSGGPGFDGVRLFLSPSETVADRWRARYPQAVAEAVGSPRLDRWHRDPGRETGTPPTIAVTFHHQGGICPESTWALPHYRDRIGASVAAWRAAGYRVVGHGHPLAEPSLRRLWAEHSVPWVTVDALFDHADVLVADNTSLLPEFASTRRPVVWLNAPWYRRDVEHGGRFWSWPYGQIQVDEPGDLAALVLEGAVDQRAGVKAARARMALSIYAHADGHAAERAAAVILGLDGGL